MSTTAAVMEIHELQGAAEIAAAARSRLYGLLGLAFAFPDEDLFADVRDGTLARAAGELCRALPYALDGADALDLGTDPPSYADFESEYIRLFDVGTAGPPCPLYGGVYGGDRMKVMEDATRFYNFFDLRTAPELRELPDHLTTELEFLHYLTFRETEARQQDGDVGSLLRAERDFLARHLCKWVPKMAGRVAKQQTRCVFFAALTAFAVRFVIADHAHAKACATSL
jgi:DMSO reductase family type II enzyme chaperone